MSLSVDLLGQEFEVSGFAVEGLELQVFDSRGLSAQEERAGKVQLVVSMRVRDRQTGQPTVVNAREELRGGDDPSWVRQRVRAILGEILLHEVDEQLLVNGKRVFDPHPPEPQPAPTVGRAWDRRAPANGPPWGKTREAVEPGLHVARRRRGR